MTLTLKNIPDEVYERLEAAAETHRRSLDMQAIVCLESALLPRRVDVAARLARARAVRDELDGAHFRAADVGAVKREGRR